MFNKVSKRDFSKISNPAENPNKKRKVIQTRWLSRDIVEIISSFLGMKTLLVWEQVRKSHLNEETPWQNATEAAWAILRKLKRYDYRSEYYEREEFSGRSHKWSYYHAAMTEKVLKFFDVPKCLNGLTNEQARRKIEKKFEHLLTYQKMSPLGCFIQGLCEDIVCEDPSFDLFERKLEILQITCNENYATEAFIQGLFSFMPCFKAKVERWQTPSRKHNRNIQELKQSVMSAKPFIIKAIENGATHLVLPFYKLIIDDLDGDSDIDDISIEISDAATTKEDYNLELFWEEDRESDDYDDDDETYKDLLKTNPSVLFFYAKNTPNDRKKETIFDACLERFGQFVPIKVLETVAKHKEKMGKREETIRLQQRIERQKAFEEECTL